MSSPSPQAQAKARLRQQIRAQRKALTQDPREREQLAWAYSRELMRHLTSYRSPGTLAAFLPLPTEPPIRPALEAAAQAGWQLLLPRISGPGKLAWVAWDPHQPLAPGPLGLAEPAGPDLGSAAFHQAQLQLIPALALDRQGRRLGQGGGYYDRLLAQPSQGQKLGVVFAQEILPALPLDPWDAQLPAALTQEGICQLEKAVE